ncbi:thyroid hormone-inducible hepatic protein [Octodon degus]|uniref:Thyroid hormone-inducible hepatic protein n=1 Tax=Octodon degus TaxID=10160 RepID=A0A6P3F5Y5_OCTDE|nr:thyroid hormone-inducible hepatic protein [Octodon degus]
MPVLSKRYPRNCLLAVMDRCSAAVRTMEQVVMIPSLLRDVRPGGPRQQPEAPDLYAYFTMLKSIRVEVDHGLLPREEWQATVAGRLQDGPGDEEAGAEQDAEGQPLSAEEDLEAQFHLHFCSLHHILTHLTQKAQEVTRKYQEMTGQAL